MKKEEKMQLEDFWAYSNLCKSNPSDTLRPPLLLPRYGLDGGGTINTYPAITQ